MGIDQRAPAVSKDAYRELFERSADAILIIEGATFVDCNDATVAMLRYGSREELLQTHPSELSPPRQPDGRESFEKANEMIAIAFERGSHRFEWDHQRSDGEVFPVEVLLTTLQEPGRRTLHVVWRDITERKLLEDELRQALKMEAIGKLTGGIAHDFNNLLVAVLGHADLLTEVLADRPDAQEHVDVIRKAGERAADLVRQLLAFGRKQQLLPTVLDLNELTIDMRSLIERLVGEGVTLVTKFAEGPVPIKADRSQIEQVLLNLAANARDALQGGGELMIETGRVHLPGERGDAGQNLPAGDYALLAVSDTGGGMDAVTAEHAFDPFFTTKQAGHGSGLGLATVYGIVKQSNGAVSLHTSVGHGTRAEILLPLTTEELPAHEPVAAVVAQGKGGGETILAVEDEAVVRSLVERTLTERGYRVLACKDGLEAMALFAQHGDEIALLLTDVIMPNMGGPQLVSELRKLGHRPMVLFMSGYTNEALTQLHEGDDDVEFLEKPFDANELARRVRAVLARS
jgi:two-component system cell cycle sensor histidine kinase/response regulator CckA